MENCKIIQLSASQPIFNTQIENKGSLVGCGSANYWVGVLGRIQEALLGQGVREQ